MCRLRERESQSHRAASTNPLSSPTCSEVGESHGFFVELYFYKWLYYPSQEEFITAFIEEDLVILEEASSPHFIAIPPPTYLH